MKEQEIEKLALEYQKSWGKFEKTEESYYGFIEGYKAALSNPNYILIEKEYIENRIKKLEEDLQVVVHNNDANVIGANITVLAFGSARILSGITELKDILSNSKVT